MPGSGVADGDPNLLNEDEEGARPDGGAVKLAGRPKVVGYKNEQEDVGHECGLERIPVTPDGPTGDGGDHQCDGADKDEAFVGRGIGTGAKGEKDEGREDQHVCQGDDVEKFRIDGRRGGVAVERIRRGQDAEDDHETGQEKSRNAETAMDVDASGEDQGSLRDEQEDPAGEGGPVQVNDEAGQWSEEDSGEIVGAREAEEDGGENEQGHRGEEEMIETTSGKGSGLLRRLHGAHCDCGHWSPSAIRLVGRFLGTCGGRGDYMPSLV